ITPAGEITLFPLPSPPRRNPGSIATGPDGNLWFTESNHNIVTGIFSQIGRITPSGVVTEFPLAPATFPGAIIAGPDGNLWFTQAAGFGRISPSGDVLSAFPGAFPSGLAVGPAGNLWFTDFVTDRIGRITPSGVITEFPQLPAGAGPDG